MQRRDVASIAHGVATLAIALQSFCLAEEERRLRVVGVLLTITTA